MNLDRIDTFEDEQEITELIKMLQKQCEEAMKRPDTWEFACTETKELVKNK